MEAGFWSYEAVEAALLECAELWARSPGGGTSPWASDGPWELSARELYGPDADKDAPLPRRALSRAEVAHRDAVGEWLALVEDEEARRLVSCVVWQRARSGGRADWKRVQRLLGAPIGRDGLRRRYERAIGALAQRLTRERMVLAA